MPTNGISCPFLHQVTPHRRIYGPPPPPHLPTAMSVIVQIAHLVEADHAVVFMKTQDGDEHALEFGKHHGKHPAGSPKTADHHHHDHHGHDHHSQGKAGHGAGEAGEHAAAEEHATFTPHHYAVHLHSPYTKADHGKVGVPKGTWVDAKTELTPAALNEQLKAEWYKDHVGCFVFESEKSFDAHVMALLTAAE